MAAGFEPFTFLGFQMWIPLIGAPLVEVPEVINSELPGKAACKSVKKAVWSAGV